MKSFTLGSLDQCLCIIYWLVNEQLCDEKRDVQSLYNKQDTRCNPCVSWCLLRKKKVQKLWQLLYLFFWECMKPDLNVKSKYWRSPSSTGCRFSRSYGAVFVCVPPERRRWSWLERDSWLTLRRRMVSLLCIWPALNNHRDRSWDSPQEVWETDLRITA